MQKVYPIESRCLDVEPLEVLAVLGSLATAIATVVLVVVLWRTIKQMEATVKLSKIQTEFRFRPWIGPVSSIKHIGESNGKEQFDVTIKNYGELPATFVKASFKMNTETIKKQDLKFEEKETFSLGPMLPTMEKHYWFFIDSQTIQKAKKDELKIFVALFFEYPITNGNSGYGMISQYNPQTGGFVHSDMWVKGATGLE